MPAEQVKVQGLRELTRALKAMDDQAPAEVKALNRAAAESVAPAVRALVPIGESGALSGSIKVGATARTGYVAAGSMKVPYAGVINFGWPAHNITGVHFLDKPLDDDEGHIVEMYSLGMDALLRRVGLK